MKAISETDACHGPRKSSRCLGLLEVRGKGKAVRDMIEMVK